MAGFGRRWNALGTRNRALLLGLAGAALAACALALVLQRDVRVPLFAEPLRAEQVTEVVENLAQWNVPFVAESDNVRVDPGRKRDVLLRLSLAGVPHAHLATSRETLGSLGALTPQTVLEAQQREGLAGDIASALRGVDGVEDAQVIIAPAKSATFADDAAHDATASVKLTMAPGESLDASRAAGIRAFVAASVPGLDPARVALLGDRTGGNENASGADGERAGEGESDALQRSLQSALDGVFGAGATIARVRVTYDPRARDLHETDRKPVGSRSIVTTSDDERYSTPQKRYAKTVASDERGSIVTDEHTAIAPGRLERISVAVAVDSARALDLVKIRSLAWGIVGLVESRGDTLRVEAVPFTRAPAPRAPNVTLLALIGFAGSFAPAALLLAALTFAARAGAKPAFAALEALTARAAVRARTNEIATYPPAHVRGVLRGEPPHTAAAIISALPAATATAVLELYPPGERAEIVRRMARTSSPAVPDYESVIRRG